MIEIIKNQPVSFSLGDDFNTENFECTQDNVDFCQMVVPGDTTMFQMIQTEHTGVNLAPSQPFDASFTGWGSIPGGWFYGGTVGASTFLDNIILTNNVSITIQEDVTYSLSYDVTQSANAHVAVSLTPAFGGTVQSWGTLATPDDTTGRFTAYFRVSGATTVNIIFLSVVSGSALLSINNIDLLELTQPTVTIQDSTGADVYSVTDLTYYENIIQAEFDWPSLTKGQYNICVTGIDDLSQNYIQDSLCLGLENGGGLLQENGQCIKWYG